MSQGVLHLLADKTDKTQANSEHQCEIVQQLFDLAQEGMEEDMRHFPANTPFEVSLLRDLHGFTAIDRALGLEEIKSQLLDGNEKNSLKQLFLRTKKPK
jgi:hypothetical protein